MSKAIEYGYALYELAAEEGLEKEIDKELGEIAFVLESNHDFVKLLSNPRIPISERIIILEDVFGGKIHSYLLSFMKILTKKREASLIPLCYKEYQNKYYKEKNIIRVTAISAVLLNDNQRQRIIDNMERSMHKTIMLVNKVDKTCIGGIRLEYPGYMIDASIKNRFKKLQQDIKNADYSQAEV